MKITLNELRKLINNNLLIEALNFEAIVTQNPPYYQNFFERFYAYFEKFRNYLKESFINNVNNGYEEDREKIRIIDSVEYIKRFHEACHKYLSICVIENDMNLFSLIIDIDDNLNNFVTNPTKGLKGKYTEFIIKILSSHFYHIDLSQYINLADEAKFLDSFKLIKSFIDVCEKSSSNVYKSKMQFFDNQIIPYINQLQATGKIRNVPKISSQSPLQDKVAKVFNEFGLVNGINLLKAVMDEYFEKESINVNSFAGYDVKLINFCLQNSYWQEINLPGQSGNYRIFFISNNREGTIEMPMTKDEFYTEWEKSVDWVKVYDKVESRNLDYDDYVDGLFEEAWENKLDEIKGANSDRADIEFAYRAMIYANNIYPFKTPYNSSKKAIKGADVAYFKSIKDDDYLVSEDNDNFKIRKTADWCTKDKTIFYRYWAGTEGTDLISGFLLILNNSLPYNDPNGAALIGLVKNKIKIPGSINRYEFYETIHELNAKDEDYQLPDFINEFCGEKKLKEVQKNVLNAEELDLTLNNFEDFKEIITQNQNQYEFLSKIKASDYLRDVESGQDIHQILQNLVNQKKINENQISLLRRYIKQLLM